MRQFLEANSFQAVGAGQQATLELPVGRRVYHAIRLKYLQQGGVVPNQAAMEADITEVRLIVSGKDQRRFTLKELFAINALNGVGVTDGIIPIFLSEPWRRTPLGEDALAWGTDDIDNFQMEVVFAPTATPQSLSARLVVEKVARPMGPIIKWKRFSLVPGAVGEFVYTSLPRIDAYHRLHFFEQVDNDIAAVEVAVDQEEVFEATREEAESLYIDNGLVPQAKLFPVIFDHTQRADHSLPMILTAADGSQREVSELRLRFQMAAARAFNLLTETIGLRD